MKRIQETKISLDFINDINTDVFKLLIDDCKIDDEVFYYFSFKEGDIDKDIITHVSLNYKPSLITTEISREENKSFVQFSLLHKLNKHFTFALGKIGWTNNQFTKNKFTQEIIIL